MRLVVGDGGEAAFKYKLEQEGEFECVASRQRTPNG